MPFPPTKDVEIAVLKVISQMGGQALPRDVYPEVTKLFQQQLTPADLSRTVKSGDNAWTNCIQFVRQRLVEKGELDRKTYGLWSITDKGRQRIGGTPPVAPPPTIPQIPTNKATQLAQQAKAIVDELAGLVTKGQGVLPSPNHEQLVAILKEMGQMLGKNVDLVPAALYKHDCVWKPNQWAMPAVVAEVCDKGVLDKDIASLQWALNTWHAKAILVIVDESDFAAAQRKLSVQEGILLIKAEDLVRLASLIKTGNIEVIRVLFGV